MTRAFPVYLALFLGVVCMSTSSIMIRLSIAPALIIALYRLAFTSGLAGSWQLLPGAQKASSLSKWDILCMCGSGFFLALHFAFWISSLGYTSISSSVLFTNLQVIFVLAFSIFFLGERPRLSALIGIITALLGSALIGIGDLNQGRLGGDMLALASGLFVAFYFLTGRYVRARVDTMLYTFIVSGVAAVVVLAACSGMGLPLAGHRGLDWLLFLLMAVGPGLGGMRC